MGLTFSLHGCDEGACVLHSECAAAEVCHLGACRRACGDDGDCPVDLECRSGACLTPDPDRRFVCRDDAGCPEAGMDAAPDAQAPDATRDASLPDASLPDASLPDASLPDAQGPDGEAGDAEPGDGDVSDAEETDAEVSDAAVGDGEVIDGEVDAVAPLEDAGPPADAVPPPDATGEDAEPPFEPPLDAGPLADAEPDGAAGPPPIDFSGVYAVTHTVLLSGSPDFTVGDVTHTIVTLQHREGTRYRLEAFDQQGGEILAIPSLDLAAPEEDRYQFEHAQITEPTPGCRRVETRFQRGRFEPGLMSAWRLAGDEDLAIRFDGEDCGEEDAVVLFHVEWNPIPR